MTGQVKEEVLTRFGELGFRVIGGRATLAPGLIAPEEVFAGDGSGERRAARFTVCSVPMVITAGAADAVAVVRPDGTRDVRGGLALGPTESTELFGRSGSIERVEWVIGESTMARWSRTAPSLQPER